MDELTGFQPHEDDATKAYCTFCYPRGIGRKYIKNTSIRNHINSDRKHLAALSSQKDAAADRERRRAEQAIELQERENIRPLTIGETPLHLPPVHHSSATIETTEVPEGFWENADYDIAGPEIEMDEETRLQKDVEKLLNGVNDDLVPDALGMRESQESLESTLAEQEDERMLSDMMENAAIHDDVLNQVLHGESISNANPQWAPYNSKTMCILDILDNLPRLRISDTMMKLFIWALKECGVNDTPSFYALCKVQKDLRKKQGVPSMECKSGQGKIFFVNDIREIVKHDWANPAVRPHIQVYPEIPEDGIVREVWHAEKWRKDMDLDILSPMYDAQNGCHFYVFEIARLKDGQLVIPIRWIIAEHQVFADAFKVHLDSEMAIISHHGREWRTLMIPNLF
ncbi:hypothetical protein K435DRAFT_808835 [Dendrothele bispora CBS 962.96]|uniref:Uncharacterized protein n=1 Tax=Dendrothele bispora (strain CBS 962.96) TaxID=1314807 RepID=A0A4S8L045_DENBC|nr:hypothetical protein K435DRAFT_808835 [Dendrothele bispora CBS 962.96]